MHNDGCTSLRLNERAAGAGTVGEQNWRPLFTRDSSEEGKYDVLCDGILDWLQVLISRWLAERAAPGGSDMIDRPERRLHQHLTGGLAAGWAAGRTDGTA